jgi:hypothetical protein
MNNFTLDQHTKINKFIHRRLACIHRENLYYGYHDPMCYSCINEIDTQYHIITCSNIKGRQEWKRKYCKDISKILINSNTEDNLRRCTKAWIYGRDIPIIEDMTDKR